MRRKMPRSVTRANGSGNGGRRGDQRAETGERRGARFNRLAVSRCVVVYSLRVELRSSRRPRPRAIVDSMCEMISFQEYCDMSNAHVPASICR